ncbi:glycine cleavage system aminomethyltransferase GcvT [Ezakiella peruensis]|uniref:glycine cleavage system aminomethyltransferase GcvT n=1 Tax=Ezakiella peruensis TaxID=1464038 RepID=UPI000C1B5AD0|nr:glycine cleavage system aminomethyltransferase GcvT [Ezakiella peruensis]
MTMKTPLYEKHVALGGNVVEYAGWMLPVEYTGLKDEHNAVRERAGMFDVSHMGEIWVEGKEAEKFVNYLMTNNIINQEDNQIQYTFMCYEDGGVVDDLLVYKYNNEKYYLVVNAANVDKDFDWIKEQSKDFDVKVTNVSNEVGEVAVQGPKAQEVVQKLTDLDLDTIKFFYFKDDVEIAGVKCMISRTGYTGEDGFEIYTTNEGIVKVWDAVLEAGKDVDLKPCGLGCRDTLRFEASLPLYGQEISKELNPVESGFKYFVDRKSDNDYIGREALLKIAEDPKKVLVGFELVGRGIPREGYKIEKDGKEIGHVTTGYLSPTLGTRIGNALIDVEYKGIGNTFDVMVRNKPVEAKIISKKFLEARGDQHKNK